MNVHDAIINACASVGIKPPRSHREGRWTKTDTLYGKSGKGDGRIIVDDRKVVAWNWQTGEKETVWLNGTPTPVERREMAREIEANKREQQTKATQAAKIATAILARSKPAQHPYLVDKGFPHDRGLVADATTIRSIGGAYLVPDASCKAGLIIPAKIGDRVSSIQVIWEGGQKKFLSSGTMEGATHRIASGAVTWLFEGFATGLALRRAFKGLGLRPTLLCCFSAYNVSFVARHMNGKVLIATDNDKPMRQFDGLGTGEYYAKMSGRPYVMPPTLGTDFNDMLMSEGIFAVQRCLAEFAKGAHM